MIAAFATFLFDVVFGEASTSFKTRNANAFVRFFKSGSLISVPHSHFRVFFHWLPSTIIS